MALTANQDVDHYIDQQVRTFPVAAGENVYKGGFVGLTGDGYARGLVAGDRFIGIAYEAADNSSGAAGDISIRTFTQGDFGLTVTGVVAADRLKEVYATDDNTLTLTGGASASYVGHVLDVPASNQAIVRLGELGDLPSDNQAAQINFFEDFLGAAIDTAAGPWKTVDVGDATEALAADTHAGELALALAATSEAEDAVLYHGDQKNFDIDSALIFECRAKAGAVGSGVTVVFGMAGDHHLVKDSVAEHAWFRLDGSLSVKAESDDGTTDIDDQATGLTLTADTYYTFRIDFTDPSDVKFFINGTRYLASTTFDLSAYAGTLQPYFSLDKASGTGTASLTIDWVQITATRA